MKTKGKIKIRNIAVIIIVVLFLIVFYSLLYSPSPSINESNKETNRKLWAIINISGSVLSETADAYEERRSFLKGEKYQLHNTNLIIENITYDGKVTIKFEPEVINLDTDELIETIVINRENVIYIEEVCNNNDSATWCIRVIGNKYEDNITIFQNLLLGEKDKSR